MAQTNLDYTTRVPWRKCSAPARAFRRSGAGFPPGRILPRGCADRTARESRPEINNDFSGVRHASVFEGMHTATAPGELIHKIISAPILYEGKVVGVMQISRKGTSTATSGPDFSAGDLGKVLALCRPLGKLVQHFGGE